MLDPVVIRDAVVFSSLLSLLSAGLTLTYMTTKVPNFAHGSFATVAIYVVFALTNLLGVSPYLGIAPAVLISAITALGMYVLVVRPLMKRGSSIVALMISTLAFDLILIALLNIFADILAEEFKLYSRNFTLRSLDFRLFGHPGLFFIAPTVLAIVVTAIYLLLTRTKFGVAMRAAIENPSLASVVGVNVDLVYAVSWFLAGALAGLAGAFMALWYVGNTWLGSNKLPSIFAASILGGLSSIYGAIAGGLIMGVAEVLGTVALAHVLGTWVAPYRPLIPLAVMALMLLVAPQGIAGLWSSLEVKKRAPSA